MTRKEYDAYERAYTEGLARLELTYFSPGTCRDCPDCCPDDGPVTDEQLCAAGEPHFSWWPCELCGRPLGGDRYPAHGIDGRGELYHLDVCTDCVYYSAYGQLDDETMLGIAESE